MYYLTAEGKRHADWVYASMANVLDHIVLGFILSPAKTTTFMLIKGIFNSIDLHQWHVKRTNAYVKNLQSLLVISTNSREYLLRIAASFP